ncbi:hypothetical protein [Hydrogenophaga sp.]|nr:hypothetical protein [Hydrogenophaga sp.]
MTLLPSLDWIRRVPLFAALTQAQAEVLAADLAQDGSIVIKERINTLS